MRSEQGAPAGVAERAAARDLDPPDAERDRRPGNRWAVLIGISDYHDDRLSLRFAHRDAQALRDLLVTDAGGTFAPERIKLLRNRDATTAAVIAALRSFLGQTTADDVVVIFLACHGAPDRAARGRPLFLLTHDTNLDDVAATALPMDEIAWCLRNYVRAERVVVIADTCHSAGIVGTRGESVLDSGAVTSYLHAMSTDAEASVDYLVSARLDQLSLEGEEWGGGHGVFTHFLLEGLRGAADGYGSDDGPDGYVGLDELYRYVADHVSRATRLRQPQQPLLGGPGLDPQLALAATGGLDAQRHLELARSLLEVGRLLADEAPHLCAAWEAGEAVRMAGLVGSDLPTGRDVCAAATAAAQRHRRAAEPDGGAPLAPPASSDPRLATAREALLAGRPEAASAALASYTRANSWGAAADRAQQALATLAAAHARAVVIAPEGDAAVPMHRVLVAWGIDDVVMRVWQPNTDDQEAREEIRQLSEHAADQLGVLAVVGEVRYPIGDAAGLDQPNLVLIDDGAQRFVDLFRPALLADLRTVSPTRCVTISGAAVVDAIGPRQDPGPTYAGLGQGTGIEVAGQAAAEPMFRHRTRTAAAVAEVDRLPARVAGARIDDQLARRGVRTALISLERGLAYAAEGRDEDAVRELKAARYLVESQLSVGPGTTEDIYRETHFHLGRLLRVGTAQEDLLDGVAALRRAMKARPSDRRILAELTRADEALRKTQTRDRLLDITAQSVLRNIR